MDKPQSPSSPLTFFIKILCASSLVPHTLGKTGPDWREGENLGLLLDGLNEFRCSNDIHFLAGQRHRKYREEALLATYAVSIRPHVVTGTGCT